MMLLQKSKLGKEYEMITEEKNMEELQNFVCSQELEKLEDSLEDFNIFDCLCISKREDTHSKFLAWLLDPNENHGLGNFFLKRFLKRALKNNSGKDDTPTVFDIDIWDMSGVDIETEYGTDDKKRIDLLLIDDKNKFVLIIENKIDSSQHGNQLENYKKYIDKEFLKYKKLFIYLKPKKDETIPAPWVYLRYDEVKDAIDDLLGIKNDTLGTDIKMAVSHYKKLLEGGNEHSVLCRSIYNSHKKAIDLLIKKENQRSEEITHLCTSIYTQHKKAIDLINEYNDKSYIFKELKSIVMDNISGLVFKNAGRAKIQLLSKKAFDKIKFKDEEESNTENILYAEIYNRDDCVKMCIVIVTPLNDTPEQKKRRDDLLEILRKVFGENGRKVDRWICFDLVEDLINKEEYKKRLNDDKDELCKKLEDRIKEKLIKKTEEVAEEYINKVGREV